MGISILNNENAKFIGVAKINSMIVSSNPDWAAKDTEISLKLIRLFIVIVNKIKIKDIHFSIAEKSDDEKKPHYLIDVLTGNSASNDVEGFNICVEYGAIEGENFHLGDINLLIKFEGSREEMDFIGRILLEEYIKLLGVYYPEFDAVYFEQSPVEKYAPYKYVLENGE